MVLPALSKPSIKMRAWSFQVAKCLFPECRQVASLSSFFIFFKMFSRPILETDCGRLRPGRFFLYRPMLSKQVLSNLREQPSQNAGCGAYTLLSHNVHGQDPTLDACVSFTATIRALGRAQNL